MGSVVVDSLLNVPNIVCGGSVFGHCLVSITLCPFNFAIIWMSKRELVLCFIAFTIVILMSCDC